MRKYCTNLSSFCFRYLEDLGASKLLMGASLAVGTAAGVPVTLFSRSYRQCNSQNPTNTYIELQNNITEFYCTVRS